MNNINDTSSSAQRSRLLNHLIAVGAAGVNRFQAADDLNIIHLGARIKELRNAGNEILTIRETLEDDHGRRHQGIARYVLIRRAQVTP